MIRFKGQKIKIGDRIVFRSSEGKTIRKVNGFWGYTSKPTVRYKRYHNFVVRPSEIIDIIK